MNYKTMPSVGDRVYTVRFDLSTWEDGKQLITRRTVIKVNTNLGYVYTKAKGGNRDCFVA